MARCCDATRFALLSLLVAFPLQAQDSSQVEESGDTQNRRADDLNRTNQSQESVSPTPISTTPVAPPTTPVATPTTPVAPPTTSVAPNNVNETLNQTLGSEPTLPPGFVYSTHCDVADFSPLSINDPMMICVFLSTTPPKKMIFKIVVEEYSSLVLQGSKDLALGAKINKKGNVTKSGDSEVNHDIHTWIARSDAGYAHPSDCNNGNATDHRPAVVSCPQIYASASHVAQMLSLVINLREGLIHSFVWDNGCAACGPDRCMKSARSLSRSMIPVSDKFEAGSCGRTYVKCNDPNNPCDLQILVTWAGTDKNGNHLISAGRRLSRFGGGTINSMYETMDSELR